jgi:hypothetical protein
LLITFASSNEESTGVDGVACGIFGGRKQGGFDSRYLAFVKISQQMQPLLPRGGVRATGNDVLESQWDLPHLLLQRAD